MKRNVLIAVVLIILAITGCYYYQLSGFAKGVNQDTRRRDKILKQQAADENRQPALHNSGKSRTFAIAAIPALSYWQPHP